MSNKTKTPFRPAARQQEAEAAAVQAGPREGDKLMAALDVYGLPSFLVDDGGVSYVLVAVDGTADEGDAHTGPKVYLHSGEDAMRPAAEHEEPWSASLYDGEGEFIDVLFVAQAGIPLEAESAHAALCLASWLAAHSAGYPRTRRP